jgi:ketosteroid isomerase-like protein
MIGRTMSGTPPSSVDLVLAYIAAARRARETQDPRDFDVLRSFLADDVVIRQASPWADDPWQVIHRDSESVINRLQAPSNTGTVLQTETVNAVAAGDEVLVEQVATITTSARVHVSSVCFLFSVTDGRITGGRLYRNDAGLPTG